MPARLGPHRRADPRRFPIVPLYKKCPHPQMDSPSKFYRRNSESRLVAERQG